VHVHEAWLGRFDSSAAAGSTAISTCMPLAPGVGGLQQNGNQQPLANPLFHVKPLVRAERLLWPQTACKARYPPASGEMSPHHLELQHVALLSSTLTPRGLHYRLQQHWPCVDSKQNATARVASCY